jgi:hypothetical protein
LGNLNALRFGGFIGKFSRFEGLDSHCPQEETVCPLELHFDADESPARVDGNERVKRKSLINNSRMGSINNRDVIRNVGGCHGSWDTARHQHLFVLGSSVDLG